MKRIPYVEEHVRTYRTSCELSTKASTISRNSESSQFKTSKKRQSKSSKSLTKDAISIDFFTFATLFKSSRHSNSFTSNKFLSNIVCSLRLRNFFYCRNLCSFACDARNCFAATICNTFASTSCFFNFFIARSIATQFTFDVANSHFFLERMHSLHLREREERRYSFCLRAQRLQAIMTI